MGIIFQQSLLKCIKIWYLSIIPPKAEDVIRPPQNSVTAKMDQRKMRQTDEQEKYNRSTDTKRKQLVIQIAK
jgi:hypothetical protein